MISCGYNKRLELNDCFSPANEDESRVLTDQLETLLKLCFNIKFTRFNNIFIIYNSEWSNQVLRKKDKASLFQTIWRVHGLKLFLNIFLIIFQVILKQLLYSNNSFIKFFYRYFRIIMITAIITVTFNTDKMSGLNDIKAVI